MKSFFHPSLVNNRFEDPSLYVDIPWERRGLLFDLGANYFLSPRKLLKVSDVFVSHAHMDHFIGFDHLLRLRLTRERPLRLYGPPGIIDRVSARLSGYTWNLVNGYSFSVEVNEIHAGRMSRSKMVAHQFFRPNALGEQAIPDAPVTILDDGLVSVTATLVDHKIPCVAYALSERCHVNINADALEKAGLPTGDWLRKLKEKVRAGAGDGSKVQVPGRGSMRLGELREAVVSVTPGQKIAYVVDAAFHAENVRRIVELVREADVLFCEAAFMERDLERARETYHLTACQAGWLARRAGVKRLEVFHFSPRYEREPEALPEEAMEAFRGKRVPSFADEAAGG
jgi:ribonuclease Z